MYVLAGEWENEIQCHPFLNIVTLLYMQSLGVIATVSIVFDYIILRFSHGLETS